MWVLTHSMCTYPCRFVCEGTVEDKISILQEKKKDLAQKVLSGTGASFTKLSLADLRVIFGVWRSGSNGGGGSQTEDQVVAGPAILKQLCLLDLCCVGKGFTLAVYESGWGKPPLLLLVTEHYSTFWHIVWLIWMLCCYISPYGLLAGCRASGLLVVYCCISHIQHSVSHAVFHVLRQWPWASPGQVTWYFHWIH